MSDLENFRAMLTRSGHTWTEQSPARWSMGIPVDVGTDWASETCVELYVSTVLDVSGCFYDTLLVAFDADGGLIDMHSHVAHRTASPRAIALHAEREDLRKDWPRLLYTRKAKNHTSREYDNGVTIYESHNDAQFSVAHGSWVTGAYASEEAAMLAPFVDVDKLHALWNSQTPTPMTLSQLRALTDTEEE